MTTIAFNVHGTLMDPKGLLTQLEPMVGSIAADFYETWRSKALEYSFRRALMGAYQPFPVCSAEALEYACQRYKQRLSRGQRSALLSAYQSLPVYEDVVPGLRRLRAAGLRLFAFSGASQEELDRKMRRSGLDKLLDGAVSVEPMQSFKPSPRVYEYLLLEAEAEADEVWMVSSRPFDIIGALAFGLHGVWLRRDPEEIFDPWGYAPTRTVSGLLEFANELVPA